MQAPIASNYLANALSTLGATSATAQPLWTCLGGGEVGTEIAGLIAAHVQRWPKDEAEPTRDVWALLGNTLVEVELGAEKILTRAIPLRQVAQTQMYTYRNGATQLHILASTSVESVALRVIEPRTDTGNEVARLASEVAGSLSGGEFILTSTEATTGPHTLPVFAAALRQRLSLL